MARVNLATALRKAVKTESFEAEFVALSPLVFNFDMPAIVAAMAPPLVEGIGANLLAGRLDGQPRGVQTGLLARSIAARPSSTGLQVYADGARGHDGSVMRTFYGKFRIAPRGATRLQKRRGKWSGVTKVRTSGEPVIITQGRFWKQPFMQEAIKRAIAVIVPLLSKYRSK